MSRWEKRQGRLSKRERIIRTNAAMSFYAAASDKTPKLLDVPPETTRANWGHIGTLLEFNRTLSEASYFLNKQIDLWEKREAERCSNA